MAEISEMSGTSEEWRRQRQRARYRMNRRRCGAWRIMSLDNTRATASATPPSLVTRRAERDWALRPLGAPSYPLPSRWQRGLGALGGAVLGAVLLLAVWGKMLDPQGFSEQIHADGLDWLLPAGAVALLVLALEAGLGTALLIGVRRLWVLLPVTLLVAGFMVLNGRAYWLSAHGVGALGSNTAAGATCGCFGNLVQRTPAEAFWQDILLLLPPLALAFRGRDRNQRRLPPLRTALVAAVTVAVPVFAWLAPDLPLDDLATRLKPGAEVGKLCAGSGRDAVCLDGVVPDLDHGNHLVVMGDLDDPALAKAVAPLNAYSATPSAPAIWLLTASDATRQRVFFWKWGPSFKIVEAPAALLRPLYRRLPRSFAVQEGRVTATFSGLPPLPASGRSGDGAGNPSERPDR
jgi:uncharacterized membrane protein YphA (DoxX/SURF4 family)